MKVVFLSIRQIIYPKISAEPNPRLIFAHLTIYLLAQINFWRMYYIICEINKSMLLSDMGCYYSLELSKKVISYIELVG